MKRAPSMPQVFAISCGSAITVAVPCGTEAAAKERGVIIVLSTCMCPSMKPGTSRPPAQSISSAAS